MGRFFLPQILNKKRRKQSLKKVKTYFSYMRTLSVYGLRKEENQELCIMCVLTLFLHMQKKIKASLKSKL